MNKFVYHILLTLISLTLFSCQSTYLGYKNIPELTITAPDLTSGLLFSDDGDDFLFWSDEEVHIYSLKDNTPILYKKISLDKTKRGMEEDVFYSIFSVSSQIPNSFNSFKNYAKSAKKYGGGKFAFPIVNYKQRIAALKMYRLGDFCLQNNSQDRIFLDKINDGGQSVGAMSAFDMNTWCTMRNYSNPDSVAPNKWIFPIHKYYIWKNRNGEVSSFSITPADLGMKEPDVGHTSYYISPSGKYVFIIYGSPDHHISGRSPTFGDLVKLFTNSFRWQNFYVAIIDVDTEKIIQKKTFSSYKNYYPSYKRGFALSEKRKIFAHREAGFIKFYHLNDIK